jgi:hypothetical protein
VTGTGPQLAGGTGVAGGKLAGGSGVAAQQGGGGPAGTVVDADTSAGSTADVAGAQVGDILLLMTSARRGSSLSPVLGTPAPTLCDTPVMVGVRVDWDVAGSSRGASHFHIADVTSAGDPSFAPPGADQRVTAALINGASTITQFKQGSGATTAVSVTLDAPATGLVVAFMALVNLTPAISPAEAWNVHDTEQMTSAGIALSHAVWSATAVDSFTATLDAANITAAGWTVMLVEVEP